MFAHRGSAVSYDPALRVTMKGVVTDFKFKYINPHPAIFCGRALRQFVQQFKWNPNPGKTVYYGEMTWEEMMFPFFGVVVDKDADTRKIRLRNVVPPGA